MFKLLKADAMSLFNRQLGQPVPTERDQQCADLGDWVSEMFGWVWEAEANWRLDDRIDLATGTIRVTTAPAHQAHHTCSLPVRPQWSWSAHECTTCRQKWQYRGNGWWPV